MYWVYMWNMWEANEMTSIKRLEGKFIQEKPQDKKPKPKRDTCGAIQCSMHKSSRHAGAYGEF